MHARLFFSACALTVCSGCVSADPRVRIGGGVAPLDGTHYLVLGLGVISVSPPGGTNAAQVSRGKVFGVQLTNQPGPKVAIGYSDAQTVLVPAERADDVRLEARRQPDGTVSVEVGAARLK